MIKTLKTGDVRRHLSEAELKQKAESISATLVTREYFNGNSNYNRRPTTGLERTILRDIAYGALLGLNYGEQIRSDRGREQAILDTVEFISDLMLPGTNGYDTIYCPLWKALGEWPLESQTNQTA